VGFRVEGTALKMLPTAYWQVVFSASGLTLAVGKVLGQVTVPARGRSAMILLSTLFWPSLSRGEGLRNRVN
jgi:hypothetical protein